MTVANRSFPQVLPLLPAQREMWAGHLLGGPAGLDVTQAILAAPSLDALAPGGLDGLEAAWRLAVERHRALRTALAWRGRSEPVQIVFAAEGVTTPLRHLSWAPPDREALDRRFEALRVEERRRPMDLERPPLGRLVVVETPRLGARLLWTVHHLVIDGASLATVLGETVLGETVLGPRQDLGRGGELPPAPPYEDAVEALVALGEERAEEARGHWRRLMDGAPVTRALDPGGGLPAGGAPEPHQEEDQGGHREVRRALPGLLERWAEAARPAKRQGWKLSLHGLIQLAWARVLGTLTGQDEVVFAEVATLRRALASRGPLPGTRDGGGDAVGPFLVTLPVRVRVPGLAAPAAASAVASSAERTAELADQLAALRRQWRTSTRLGPAGAALPTAPDGGPLVDSLLAFHRGDPGARLEADLAASERGAGPRAAEAGAPPWRFRVHRQPAFPLALQVFAAAHLELRLSHDPRRVSEDLARDLLERFRKRLDELLELLEEHGDRLPEPAAAEPDGTERRSTKPEGTELENTEPPGHDPEAPLEARVAALWREVLEVETVRPGDDFFEIGGRSLLATLLLLRIHHRFGVELPIQTLFDHPTLGAFTAALARALEGEDRTADGGGGPPIRLSTWQQMAETVQTGTAASTRAPGSRVRDHAPSDDPSNAPSNAPRDATGHGPGDATALIPLGPPARDRLRQELTGEPRDGTREGSGDGPRTEPMPASRRLARLLTRLLAEGLALKLGAAPEDGPLLALPAADAPPRARGFRPLEELAGSPDALSPSNLAEALEHQGALAALLGRRARASCPEDPAGVLFGPASLLQRRLYLHERSLERPVSYHIPFTVRLGGPLDTGALVRALGEVVDRHDSLRSGLHWLEDEVILQVLPASTRLRRPLTPGLVDLRGLSPERARAAAESALDRACREPFELASPPLLRALLLGLPPGPGDASVPTPSTALALVAHHAIWDQLSTRVFLDDLLAAYGGGASGAAAPSYLTYALAERRAARLLEADPAGHGPPFLESWRRAFAEPGTLEPLELSPEGLEDRSPGTGRAGRAGRDRPAERGGSVRPVEALPVTLPPELTARCRRLAQELQASPFMVLLAAFQGLLGLAFDRRRLSVSTPFSTRRGRGGFAAVGYFVNLWPLPADTSPERPFEDLVAEVRRRVLEASSRPGLTAEQLIGPDRPGGASPKLWQTVFTYEAGDRLAALPKLDDPEDPGSPATAGGLSVEVGFGRSPGAKFDLILRLVEEDDRLTGQLAWAADAVAPAIAGHLARTLPRLLAALVRQPEAPLGTWPLLDPAERRAVLETWSRGREGSRAALPFEPVHAQVRRRAAEHPELPAALLPEPGPDPGGGPGASATPPAARFRPLTYGRLEAESRALARRLERELAAGAPRPEARIGLAVDRGAEWLVGLLATARAGAVAVPLDPHLPPERLARLVTDAAIDGVVLTPGTAARLDEVTPLLPGDREAPRRVELALDLQGPPPSPSPRAPEDRASENRAPENRAPEDRAPGDRRPEEPRPLPPEQLAYVLFTSGSTGRPKGVAVPHRGLAGLVRWHHRTFPVRPGQRVAQTAGVGFDASLWEAWTALTAGATLVFPPREAVVTPASLTTFLEASGVTQMFLSTYLAEGLLRHLAAHPEAADRLELQVLHTGGDTLGEGPDPALEERTGLRLVNHYGPTEATVITSSGPVSGRDRPEGRGDPDLRPTIGRPLDGVRVLLLGSRLQPVAPGFPGELLIGGDGLARGYLGSPGRTAEAFIPHPFPEGPGERLYRTGDRALWRPDGQIAFLGRLDAQVQLRGVRVELGEVEHALTHLPRVAAGAVVIEDGPDGAPRLVAYAEPLETVDGDGDEDRGDDGAPVTPEGIRAALARRLPTAMVPSRVVLLETLPLTPSGKVDRRALAASGKAASPQADSGFEGPRTSLERTLAEWWAEELGDGPPIGRRDNFFDRGGGSLEMMRLIARIQEGYGVELYVKDVFEAQTLEEMARTVLSRLDAPLLEVGLAMDTHSDAGNDADRDAARDAGPGSPGEDGPASLVIPLAPGGERVPLVCVHAAGGHLTELAPLARHLDPQLPYFGIQSPGLDRPEPTPDRVEAFAERYAAEILRALPDGPWALGGFCTGGHLALATARELDRQGFEVERVVLLDTRWNPPPPAGHVLEDPWILGHYLFGGELRTPLEPERFVGIAREALRDLLWEEFETRWPEDASRLGRRRFDRLLGVYVANVVAQEDFQRRPTAEPFDAAPVLLVEPEEVEAQSRLGLERSRERWESLCRAGLEVVQAPGSHFTFLAPPHVEVVGELLSERLRSDRTD